ncbi:hypothetical protein QTG54_008331 [Skeletonema marinoi]|uniref:Uncharacterized protein n=1 Tax=Skeletonema marinoi TaxID=267567 RepID=A0AAD8Y8Q7_9STRA|nr:hypothetical protein QTG54_008331 [Skeletonema marinoi]
MMMINQAAATCCLLLSALASSSQAVNIRGATAINEAVKNNDHSERRQLNLFCSCISAIDSSCHPNSECESFDKCTNPKGKDKCNASGSYIWRPLSTPPPTTASTPPPPPSSSCGKCVADNYSTTCSAPTDCPTVSSPERALRRLQPTNGSECTQDSQCEPSSANTSSDVKSDRCSNSTTNWKSNPPPSPLPTPTPTLPPTANPTDAATPPPTENPTPPPSPQPSPQPTTFPPTSNPTDAATPPPTAPPSPQPTPNPTAPTQTYCGCPECTSTIWNADACDVNLGGCYTCGGRIDYLKGLGQTEEQACTTVSDQFPNGPCGPVCNPNVCNGTPEPTPDPTPVPTAPPSPGPSTDSPTEQFFCGCSACTTTIWNSNACRDDLGGCYTCGAELTI